MLIVAGTLKRIEDVLEKASYRQDWASVRGGGNPLHVWTFACRYKLLRVVRAIEEFHRKSRFLSEAHIDEAGSWLVRLPFTSQDIARVSLLRMKVWWLRV